METIGRVDMLQVDLWDTPQLLCWAEEDLVHEK